MNRVHILPLLMVLILDSSQVVQSQPAVNSVMVEGHVEAPEFPDGFAWLNTSAPIKLRDLRGKFVLLDFWTFCCINCMHVIPDLKKLEEKYAQELVVIGVHSAKFRNEKETTQIREAVLRYGLRHPVVNDSEFKIWKNYSARAWPTLVLINPKGKVVGSMSGEGVFTPMDRILAEGIPYFLNKGDLVRSPLKTTLEEAARPETLLSYPGKISGDPDGHKLFISDSNHNRILITDANGHILDVIGSGEEGQDNGPFEVAQLNHPQGTFLANGILYIADTENHLIRTANLKTRQVQTVLGTGTQARRMNQPGTGREVAINSPWDLLVHDGVAYIAMAGFHQIWSADIKSWQASPFAGSARENIADGARKEADLAQTSGLAMDGKKIYFADSETSSIRAVDLSSNGRVNTLVGKGLFEFGDTDGNCQDARLQHPLGVAWNQGLLYVADTYNSKIKIINPAKCSSETLAGNGSKGLRNDFLKAAAFNEPGGLTFLDGKLYVADTNNHAIRVVDLKAKSVSSLELTGLEKLSENRRKQFQGRPIKMPSVEVQPGKTDLSLSFLLPDGYKLNRDAPLYLNWGSPDPEVRFATQPDASDAKKISPPVNIRIAALKKSSEVAIDAIIYYCTNEQSVCLVDRMQITMEVRPTDRGLQTIPVTVSIRNPAKP